MRAIAPDPIAGQLQPGPGLAVEPIEGFLPITGYRNWATHEERPEWPSWTWRHVGCEKTGEDAWVFRYESPNGLHATGTLTLQHKHRVAVYQVTLKNTGGPPTQPLADLPSLFFKLKDMQQPRVLSCSGACSTAGWPHAREFPPDAFRTRSVTPEFPRPVELSTGSGSGRRRTGSSMKDMPIFMITDQALENGPGFFVALEWSSSWHGHVFWGKSPETLCVKTGARTRDLVLDPGETLELPPAHVGFFDGGPAAGTNACRRYIFEHVMPHYMGEPTLPPIAYTLWPGIEAPYTDAWLRPHVDAAAEIGVEMFCVDADWWVGTYHNGLGNWEPDPEKFPDGLESFAEYVRSRGMGFGLAFDGGAVPGTKIVREHPEFFYELPESFWFTHKFNFSIPEACDYMVELISGYAERCDLRYIRGDFFLDPMERGEPFDWNVIDPKGKAAFAHIRGLYGVWDRLRERFPKLMLEINDGGGNSIDLGTMQRHYCGWGNDNCGSPHTCLMMQFGANTFVPPNYMGLAIGPERGGSTTGPDAGYTDRSFIGRMAGELLFHGPLADWPADVIRRAKHWAGVYKRIRHLLVRDYYRLLPQPQSNEEWDAAQFCDDAGDGVVFVSRFGGRTVSESLRLHAVDENIVYRFTNESDGQEQTVSGDQLLSEGLPVELPPDTMALYSYTRCI